MMGAMRKLTIGALLGLMGCIVVDPGPGPVEIDVRAHYRVIWVEYYGCPHAWIDTCYGFGWHDDDVAVALFLAYHAHVDINIVIGHRRSGCSWWDVTLRLNLSPMVFHVDIPSHVHVGPPYGKAYGYFRKHDPKYVFIDADCHNLVHLHVHHKYYGRDPMLIIQERESGKGWGQMVKEHHGKSRGKDVQGKPVKQDSPGHSDKGEKGKPDDKGGKPDDKGPGKGKGKNK